jgi:hypothetical protein
MARAWDESSGVWRLAFELPRARFPGGGPAFDSRVGHAHSTPFFSCARSPPQTASVIAPAAPSAGQHTALSSQSLQNYKHRAAHHRCRQFLYPTTAACHQLLPANIPARHVNIHPRRERASLPQDPCAQQRRRRDRRCEGFADPVPRGHLQRCGES